MAALLAGLLALIRMRKEGQRCIARTIDDGYRRVAHRNVVIWDRGRAIDVRLVRFRRGKVRDECRHHPASWVRRSGVRLRLMSLRLGGLRESVRVQRGAVRGGPRRGRSAFLCGAGEGFARGGVGALVARGEGTDVRGHDDRRAVIYGRGVGEVGLAEAWGGGEVYAGAKDGGGRGKRERALRRRWLLLRR